MASAQTTPIDVEFKLLDLVDRYRPPEPLPHATVRLVLGAGPDWQDADTGYRFTTDAHGEAHFTLDGVIDTRWRSRNIGFTPFSWPARSEHLQVAVELDHEFPAANDRPPKTFRWLLTMDIDRFREGTCSTSGFLAILTPDAAGRFTKPLARQPGTESWKVPELDGLVIWGMSYQVADFGLGVSEADPARRTLSFAVKRLPRPQQR